MLYILERISDVDWDETKSIVIRAEDEDRAREIAYRVGVPNGIWKDRDETTCTVINVEGINEVICHDFNAG